MNSGGEGREPENCRRQDRAMDLTQPESKWGCSYSVAAQLAILIALLTLPEWGMGPAVFLDSERKILAATKSPDGARTAFVEEIEVGGVPNLVVIVRDRWMPNLYVLGCVANHHYGNVDASVRWTSNDAITITAGSEPRYWINMAPFKSGDHCSAIETTVKMGIVERSSPSIRS